MKRIVVINRSTNEAYIEDISDEDLEKYPEGIDAYVENNYYSPQECVWSEVYSVCYIPEDSKDVIEIDLKELI